ncbi:MAG TPA: hypothetical protein PLH57_10540, partial [Oligoflexia bacterium]|nr:hypothetical protein [Oligoflexia bacterium]
LMPYANLPYFLDAMKDLKESVYKTKKPNSAERYLKEIRLYAKKKEKDTELLCDSNAVVKDSKEVERLTFTRDISSTTFIYSRSYWQSREELEYGGEATKRELFKPERIEMKYRPNVSKDANAEIKALTIRGTLYKNSGSEHPFFKCGEVRKKKVYVEPKHVDDNYDRKLTVGTLFPAFDDDGEVLPGEPVLPPSDGNYVCPQKRAK